MIKVIIADDMKLLRESLKEILELDGEIEISGCAENGLEAFDMCSRLLPDVVLMDIKMPVCDGVEGTRMIKEKLNGIKVVILTTFEDDENVSRALEKGADGYISKDVTPEELINVVKNAASGLCVISKRTYDTIVGRFKKTMEMEKNNERLNIKSILKENEIEIIKLISEGMSNKEIASQICLSEGRVKNIITGILSKLNLKDRYQLISLAYKNKLIE